MSEHVVIVELRSSRGPEYVDGIAAELLSDLTDSTNVTARFAPAEPVPGSRASDPALLGQLLVSFFGAAGLGAGLVGCLRALIDRDQTLEAVVKRRDGAEFAIRGTHLRSQHAAALVNSIDMFARGDSAQPTSGNSDG
jgi:hypothetical protein